MKAHGRECLKKRTVNRVKGYYKSSCNGNSRYLGFRNKKVTDDVAQCSFSDVGHMPSCSGLRYEK